MEKTKAFLVANRDSFEDYGYFDDHRIYYDLIEKQITPDNVIEVCKALLEAVSKTILKQPSFSSSKVKDRFDSAVYNNITNYLSKEQDNKSRTQTTTSTLVSYAIDVLAAYNSGFDKVGMKPLGKYVADCFADKYVEILKKFSSGVCGSLQDVRNSRGDISHGKAAPKYDNSTLELSNILVVNTDYLVSTMLEFLSITNFSIDDETDTFSDFFDRVFSEGSKIDSPLEKTLSAFNEELDQKWSLSEKTRYSRALYDQDRDSYMQQLADRHSEEYEQLIKLFRD